MIYTTSEIKIENRVFNFNDEREKYERVTSYNAKIRNIENSRDANARNKFVNEIKNFVIENETHENEHVDFSTII